MTPWEGEIGVRDSDAIVHEACFVDVGEAVERLRRTHRLEHAADYLDGRVELGSLSFERWPADGHVEELGRSGRGSSRDTCNVAG